MKKISFFVLAVAGIASIHSVACAAGNYTVAHGTAQCIDEHGLKKNVKNDCSRSIFVPTNTTEEWRSFVNNIAANTGCVEISDCGLPPNYCASFGAITDVRAGVTYCIWYRHLYDCGGGCPGSTSGSMSFPLPPNFRNVKLQQVAFDDSGNIYINGNYVFHKPPCSSRVYPNIDITSYVHPGANTIGWVAVNDCGTEMHAHAGIEYIPEP